MKSVASVLIVGAGQTGLTAAIELSRLGVDLRIVDRFPRAVPDIPGTRHPGPHRRTPAGSRRR